MKPSRLGQKKHQINTTAWEAAFTCHVSHGKQTNKQTNEYTNNISLAWSTMETIMVKISKSKDLKGYVKISQSPRAISGKKKIKFK